MALDDKHIIQRIAAQVERGINADDGEVTVVRQLMFERYLGQPYGNEREGYSKYITREVLNAVEWGLPALIRIFLGGQKPVEFRATSANDEDQAKHETDVVSHKFYDGSDEFSGFLTLYSWFKDILMFPNGYVTVNMVEEEEDDISRYAGLEDSDIDIIEDYLDENDIDYEITVEKEYDERDGFGNVVKLSDIVLRKTKMVKNIRVEPAPPDCVIIEHGYSKLNVDGARFSCVRAQYTRSELIRMGYSEDELDDARPDNLTSEFNSERTIRLFYSDEDPDDGADTLESDEAEEKFWRHECRMAIDFDEDGVSEYRRIVMIGAKIFENVPDDYQQIVAGTAVLMPHKHIGMAYAELVADLQELMTTLTRQLLDNIYKQNVPRTYISQAALKTDNSTMDAMLDGASEVVVVRGSPHESVMPEPIKPVIGEIISVIEQFRGDDQLRTGVAPQLTLDPSVLEKSTLGAFMGALEQASQRLELLARLLAETAIKPVFQKIHYLLRTYFDEEQDVKINGRWTKIKPSMWKKRSNMLVNVGLGFNNKQAMVTLLTTLLQIQKEALPEGLSDARKVYNTLVALIEQVNLGHATTYFNDPGEPGWQPPPKPEDPQMIVAKANAESLKRDADRRDQELKWKIGKEKEDNELRVAELMQKVDELQQGYARLMSDLALNDAKIQELNAKAFEAGIAPEDPTSADEYATARSLAGKSSGSSSNKSNGKTEGAQAT